MKLAKALSTVLFVFLPPVLSFGAPADPAWKEVKAAMQKGRPKTAIEHLERIL